MQPADRFKDLLGSGRFLLTAQAAPAKGTDQKEYLKALSFLKGKVDALFIPDNRGANAALCTLASAVIAIERGFLPVAVVSCRDRNRTALCSDMLGLFSVGVGALLCVSGDYVSLGDVPDARPVYDFDSIQLLKAAKALEDGRDTGGNPLKGSPMFALGCAANPQASPLEPHLIKLKKKIMAGAEFIVCLDAFDVGRTLVFLERIKEIGARVLVGLKLITEADLMAVKHGRLTAYPIPSQIVERYSESEKAETIKKDAQRISRSIAELKASGMCAGVHLSLEGHEDLIDSILGEAGVSTV